MRNLGFSGKWVLSDFWRLMQLEWSRLLLEMEKATGMPGKIVGGGKDDGGDGGVGFLFVDLIFLVFDHLIAATSTERRVARHWRERKLGGWRRDDRSLESPSGRSAENLTLIG
jgi:hypothetical protein